MFQLLNNSPNHPVPPRAINRDLTKKQKVYGRNNALAFLIAFKSFEHFVGKQRGEHGPTTVIFLSFSFLNLNAVAINCLWIIRPPCTR